MARRTAEDATAHEASAAQLAYCAGRDDAGKQTPIASGWPWKAFRSEIGCTNVHILIQAHSQERLG